MLGAMMQGRRKNQSVRTSAGGRTLMELPSTLEMPKGRASSPKALSAPTRGGGVSRKDTTMDPGHPSFGGLRCLLSVLSVAV